MQAAFQKRLGLRKAQLRAVSQSSEGTDSLDDVLRSSILDYDAGPGASLGFSYYYRASC